MCGRNEGPTDEIQGKIEKSIKKSRKNFGDSKISIIFAAVLRHVLKLRRLTAARICLFSSVGQST